MQKFLLCTSLIAAMVSISLRAQVTFTSGMFGALKARQIGPAVMGGRISDLVVSDFDPRVMYVGAAGGGVWKSTSGGVTFKSVFDEHAQSVGAIDIDHKRPDTVWVGTGESWTRNSVSYGIGVHLTVDGGKSWKHVGLENTERISRICVDQQQPTTAYVAAVGPLFSDGSDRGLYKTTDMGKSWTRILYIDEKTGCADVAIDPKNPNVIWAAMWQVRRTAWSFTSGGPGSGLFRSTDAGASWTKIVEGLPTGDLGRIAIAISPADSKVVYANVESEKGGLYRSIDGGTTWVRKHDGAASTLRPFYFSRLVCDPKDTAVVYKTGLNLYRSADGGATFDGVANSAHSDHHAVWIDPMRPTRFITGTDGGLYESMDEGKTVRFLATLPISQFYHVAVDAQQPYRVYGGLQDNGSWSAPSDSPVGISDGSWTFIGGGDGFHVVPERGDPKIVYWESQGGNAYRTNLTTEESKSIKPQPDSDSLQLRFNWNTPIVASPTRNNVIYMGSQFVHRSKDRGDTWERFSSDITTNNQEKLQQELSGGVTVDNSSAENHCTVVSIAESPLDPALVWAGTDDGNIQLTTNDGKSWVNVARNLPSEDVKGLWVTSVHPSSTQRNTCFVTLDGHMKGDMKPHVFRTTDLGSTWISLDTNGVEGYAHVIMQDPVRTDLLFLGTEMGLYLSLTNGDSWIAFRNEVPKVGVRDMVVHQRDNDLVLATHGRGVIIIDNLDVLRSIVPESISQDVSILPTKPAVRRLGGMGGWFSGDAVFVGSGEDRSARVWYVLKDRHIKGKFTTRLKDDQGKVIRTIPASTRKGLNSIDIPLRMHAPLTARSEVAMAGGTFSGPLLAEGRYTLELDKNGQVFTASFDVVTDTIYTHTQADRVAQQQLVASLFDLNEELAITVDRVQRTTSSIAGVLGDSSKFHVADLQMIRSFRDTLVGLNRSFVNTKANLLSGEEQLRERIASLYGEVNGYLGKPTSSQLSLSIVLGDRIKKATVDVEAVLAWMPSVNEAIQRGGGSPITPETRQETETRLRKK